MLRFYGAFADGQPDELTTYAALTTGPDRAPIVALVACYAGALDDGARAIEPFRRFGPPVVDALGPEPYLAVQGMIGQRFPAGRLNNWKSCLLREIADEAIGALVDHVCRTPSPMSAVVIADCHGAYGRVANGDTAYAQRDAPFDLVILSSWIEPTQSERNIAWTRALSDAVRPYGASVYVNDRGRDEAPDRVRYASGDNDDRLAALKRRYDPTNFFRMNQNIPPAG